MIQITSDFTSTVAFCFPRNVCVMSTNSVPSALLMDYLVQVRNGKKLTQPANFVAFSIWFVHYHLRQSLPFLTWTKWFTKKLCVKLLISEMYPWGNFWCVLFDGGQNLPSSPPPHSGLNRVKVSKNLGATAVVPAAPSGYIPE